jgi:hypothetical protein
MPENKLGAMTATGIPMAEMLAKSDGERLVHARQHAFITLAGVFGSGEGASRNPFYKYETREHLAEAVGKIMHIAGVSEQEARTEGARLIPLVNETMNDPRVDCTVQWLAKNFLRLRFMTGEEVAACIAHAWEYFGKGWERTA